MNKESKEILFILLLGGFFVGLLAQQTSTHVHPTQSNTKIHDGDYVDSPCVKQGGDTDRTKSMLSSFFEQVYDTDGCFSERRFTALGIASLVCFGFCVVCVPGTVYILLIIKYRGCCSRLFTYKDETSRALVSN